MIIQKWWYRLKWRDRKSNNWRTL